MKHSENYQQNIFDFIDYFKVNILSKEEKVYEQI